MYKRQQYPITLLQARFKKSSKMKSVKAAMSKLQEGQYDIVLIMNAENVVDTNFLEVVNNTYADVYKRQEWNCSGILALCFV